MKRRRFIRYATLAGVSAGLANTGLGTEFAPMKPIRIGKRIGIIGLDTSHSIAFTNLLNSPDAGDKYKGYKIVAAYPKGSSEIKTSYERIPKFTEDVKAKGVQITSSIKELLAKVDVVLLETNDGRLHLQQALEVIKARKQLFIDKPIANSYKDAKAIFEAAKKYNVPVFSSSSLRFSKGVQAVVDGKVGKVIAADTYSPSPLEKTHVDFFWYGIHGIEMLYALMGAGCESVTRFNRNDMDFVVGSWKDGRVGSFRGLRTPKTGYGGSVFGEKGITDLGGGYSNDDILLKIIDFFETKQVPVPAAETLELCAFIEAAQLSKNRNGANVKLSEIISK